jgi:replicative DNA helicase
MDATTRPTGVRMIAMESSIYSILIQRNTKLIKPELIKYFSGSHKAILESIFLVTYAKEPLTVDAVKNSIAQKGYKDIEMSNILGILDGIIKKDGYSSVIGHEDMLVKEYSERVRRSMTEVFESPASTVEMKNAAVVKASEDLRKIATVSDVRHHEDLIRDMVERHKEGKQDDIQKSSIKLKDRNLINIFSDTIFPHVYGILGRPGDMKTTLLLDMVNEIDSLNKRPLVITLEDSSGMAAIKVQAIRAGIAKRAIIQGKYSIPDMEQYIKKGHGNITYMDKLRTPKQVMADVDSYCECYQVDFIAIDFLQRSRKESRQSEYENISEMADVMLELNKKHNVPVFCLSQAPKDTIAGNKILGLGDEKGSGNIAHNCRYSVSLNLEAGDNPESSIRLINIYKTTVSPKGQVRVWFDPETGRICDTERVGL